jgi:hypothetical protein
VGVKMNELQGASQIWLQSPDAPGTSPIIITFQPVPARFKKASLRVGEMEIRTRQLGERTHPRSIAAHGRQNSMSTVEK